MSIRSALLAIFVLALGNASAVAEKRVALVLGMSKYQNVPALTNPAQDAAAMGEVFKKAGFDNVYTKLDLTVSELRRELRDFALAANAADIAVVYYAGHGIEVNGTNYLIPADAKLATDIDIPDETVALDRVLDLLEPVKRLRLVILDACRDNPFSKSMKRSIGMRSIGRGLARVEPTTSNTLIAFAAKAGSTAADGDGNNSPFALALMKYITAPGLDLRLAFGKVRDDVIKTTANRQEPFVYGSLGGDAVALVPASQATPTPKSLPQSDVNLAIRRDYELAERVGTREVWDYFIASYPDSFYNKLAVAQRNKLAAEEARLAATEKAKAAQEEQTRLAVEGAKKAEQDKAAAEATKAEQARVAAELVKKAEETKVADAAKAKAVAEAKAKAIDDARIAAEKKMADDKARTAQQQALLAIEGAQKAELDKATADAAKAEQARISTELAKKAEEARIAESNKVKVANLTPTANIPVGPPSFDCAKDTRPDEVAICKSVNLSYLDRQLDLAFTALRRGLSGPSRDVLKSEQQAWLKVRASCLNNEACLTSAYEDRLAQIKNRR